MIKILELETNANTVNLIMTMMFRETVNMMPSRESKLSSFDFLKHLSRASFLK